MIIDVHTHAFPDHLAARAISSLENESGIKAYHQGTISSLVHSMDDAGIRRAVICSIATKPSQFAPILAWSKKIRSHRIIPFPSIHPEDPDPVEKIKIVHGEGFKGIKLHPYYQGYFLDEQRLFPLYEACAQYQLILVSHTGFDIAYPPEKTADPVRIKKILGQFPDLLFMATHFGGWRDWDNVEKHLIGTPCYMELSFSLEELPAERAKRMIENHLPDYLLFGTDSPWTDQTRALAHLRELDLEPGLMEKILYKNAERLLGIDT